MATLTVQNSAVSGLEATKNAADAAGDKFSNDGNIIAIIENGDASDHTATFQTARSIGGLAIADPAITVTAGEERIVGPFDPALFNDSDGYVNISYDAVTSVTIQLIRVRPA